MEWLLTNGLGGFAMGSTDGIPRRRYHAMLIASLHPPLERVVLLARVADRVTVHPGTERATTRALSRFEFDEAPLGADPALVGFEQDEGVRWTWEIEGVRVTRTLHLVHGRHACLLSYEADGPATIECRPLTAMRDFHSVRSMRHEEDPFRSREVDGGVVVACDDVGVTLRSGGEAKDAYRPDRQWWRGFHYSIERDRGMDAVEDLFSPGVFRHALPWSLEASTDGMAIDRTSVVEEARERLASTDAKTTYEGEDKAALVRASDAFIVRRAPDHTTILAGYPWFADWGRDAMISLPGLLLVTGRHDEARAVLELFRSHLRRGLIPNRFDDYGGAPHYNTVDASLWFVHACAETMRATEPDEALLDACESVLTHYRDGTDFGIAMDDDHLVKAGDPTTQLTWMDAQRDGVTFTPRHGKAVEINALWIHAMGCVESFRPGTWAPLRDRAAESFRGFFVHSSGLHDVLSPPNWKPTHDVRPNQIFAASLEHGPLSDEERRLVASVVDGRLRTPAGLRTLDATDPSYRARYEGPIFERDAAYHNGTVWPWLAGALIEAWWRVGEVDRARAVLDDLRAEVGAVIADHVPEIYDAEASEGVHRPDGCPAQAWSIAEILRTGALLSRQPEAIRL